MLTLFVVAQSGCKREDVSPQGVTMQLTPSKTEYRLNEQIVIAVELTNRSDKPCRIIPNLETIVQILNLKRNGVLIQPTYTIRTHPIESERFVDDKLIQLAPHASWKFFWESISWTSTGTGIVLLAAPSRPHDPGLIARWSIDESGSYTLTARYILPALMQVLSDACPPQTEPQTMTFTISQK